LVDLGVDIARMARAVVDIWTTNKPHPLRKAAATTAQPKPGMIPSKALDKCVSV
jgi:hypothetical protein